MVVGCPLKLNFSLGISKVPRMMAGLLICEQCSVLWTLNVHVNHWTDIITICILIGNCQLN